VQIPSFEMIGGAVVLVDSRNVNGSLALPNFLSAKGGQAASKP
jgi:hypothetical protein